MTTSERLGFERLPRERVPTDVRASTRFTGACPDSAAAPPRSQVARRAPRTLPVAVLGAGPAGLALVAHLLERGQPFVVLEAGDSVGSNLLAHGHVRLFSPWRWNVDAAMARRLGDAGWVAPPDDALPTAREIVERVLQPFAALPDVAERLRLGHRVTAVSREGLDKASSAGRDAVAFVVRVAHAATAYALRASAVVDATGTWSQPNPLGADGLPAIGESALADRIAYGIPDVLGDARARYAGRRVLVVGAGHSAANVLLDLARLADDVPGTRLVWAIRGSDPTRAFGGGAADALPARGELGTRLRAMAASGRLELRTGFRVVSLARVGGAIVVAGRASDDGVSPVIEGIDEIVCATGQRPDLSIVSELRLGVDPALECAQALGPLIDPNVHSCGTVRPHGHRELSHPEHDLHTIGVKSYGRAPTFLMATGFEQARSVAAAIAGDVEAADRVELDLPETGVCGLREVVRGGPSTVAAESPRSGSDIGSCGGTQGAGGGCATAHPVPTPPPVEARTPSPSRCCG